MQKTNSPSGSISSKLLFLIMAAVLLVMAITLYKVFMSSVGLRIETAQKIQTEFFSYVTQIKQTQKLQVAELTQFERFERKSSAQFMNLPLPDIIVAISTLATYTYTVDFKATWDFELQNDVLVVYPPELDFGTPAVDLAETRFEVTKGSVLRNENAAMKSLQKDITPLLMERGKINMPLVKDIARSSIEDFVKAWLVERDPTGKEPKIRVSWRSETPPVESEDTPK